MIRLLEALEDLDDVQNVYSNFDLDALWLEKSLADRDRIPISLAL